MMNQVSAWIYVVSDGFGICLYVSALVPTNCLMGKMHLIQIATGKSCEILVSPQFCQIEVPVCVCLWWKVMVPLPE